MNRIKNNEKGITLIALVVTIIVLLILAGIAISLSIGNNGLFTRAGNAANTWRRAEANEQEEMSNFERLYDETVNDLGLNKADTIAECSIDGYTVKFTVGSTWRECIEDFVVQIKENYDIDLPSYIIYGDYISFSQYGEAWSLHLNEYNGLIIGGDDIVISNATYVLGAY